MCIYFYVLRKSMYVRISLFFIFLYFLNVAIFLKSNFITILTKNIKYFIIKCFFTTQFTIIKTFCMTSNCKIREIAVMLFQSPHILSLIVSLKTIFFDARIFTLNFLYYTMPLTHLYSMKCSCT